MKAIVVLVSTLILSSAVYAQNTATSAGADSAAAVSLKFNGYIDSYYAMDNDARAAQNRFATNPLNIAKDKFALNIVQMSAVADAERYHAKITLQYGDIAQYDWVATGEDILTPSNRIQEAYAGLRLHEGLWIDAGYFLTHIGGEAITPRDNWLASVALITQFEPIFQSGVRLSWDATSDVSVSLHALNGYNRFTDNNEQKSIGWGISYKLSPSSTLALNGIAGNEQPAGSPSLMRVCNNLVFNTSLSDALKLKITADQGMQKISEDAASMSMVYGAFASLRYEINSGLFVSGRAEFFHDADGVLSGSTKMIAQAATLGLEYRPVENAYVRCEARSMHDSMVDAMFENSNGTNSHSRLEGIFSLGVSF